MRNSKSIIPAGWYITLTFGKKINKKKEKLIEVWGQKSVPADLSKCRFTGDPKKSSGGFSPQKRNIFFFRKKKKKSIVGKKKRSSVSMIEKNWGMKGERNK